MIATKNEKEEMINDCKNGQKEIKKKCYKVRKDKENKLNKW